jgi:hemerythrin-like domain-containing protein
MFNFSKLFNPRYFAQSLNTSSKFYGIKKPTRFAVLSNTQHQRSFINMANPRYRVFREHKLVTGMLTDFRTFVEKADFRKKKAVDEIKEKLSGIIGLMNGHAEHEDKRIHQFLRDKNSHVQDHVEKDHGKHADLFKDFNAKLEEIQASDDPVKREQLGYLFHLALRNFEGENLRHLHEEETVLMPELQRLYTDEELRQIDAPNYEMMTSEEMVHMLKALFPYYNPQDRRVFLQDIQFLQPVKFLEAWKGIESEIADEERAELIVLLKINVNSEEYKAAKAAAANIRFGWEAGDGKVIQTKYERDKNSSSSSTMSDSTPSNSPPHSPVSKGSFLAPKPASPKPKGDPSVSSTNTDTDAFRMS